MPSSTPVCGSASKVNATLPVHACVILVPFSCGKRSVMKRCRIGALTSGDTCVNRARPPNTMRRPSGDMR
jgi:hypothetical protein